MSKHRPAPPPRRASQKKVTSPVITLSSSMKEGDATIIPRERSATLKPRPLSTGLNRDFMQALDQKIGSTKERRVVNVPRQISDGHQSFELETLSPNTKRKNMHRRTASTGAPKEKSKVKLSDVNTDSIVPVSMKSRKSGSGKGKKFFDKIKNRTGEISPLDTPVNERVFLSQEKEEFARFMFNASLVLLGYPQQEIVSITNHIETSHFRSVELSNETFNETIKTIQKRMLDFSGTQNHHACATKIQTAFRAWRVRKAISPILKNEIECSRVISYARNFCALLSQEKNYCSTLQTIIERYLMSARQKIVAGKEIMKLEEISYVFSNVEIILEVHKNLLKKLQKISDTDWPLCRGVGRVLVENRKGFTSYGVYVGNFVTSQDTVTRLCSDRSGKFSMWLSEVESKGVSSRNLQFLLSEPLNHISKMHGCLEAMAGFLPATGTEERELVDAYTMIYETDKFVQEQLTKSENIAVLMDIQRRIIHDKPLDIVKDDRKSLIESQFTVGGHKRVFILLTDALLIGKPSKNNQFRLKEIRTLEVVQFEKGAEGNFIIKTPTAVYKISGRPEECAEWVNLLSEYEESNKINRTIGVHMSTILKREKDPSKVPSIVTQCIDRIREIPGGTATEGLFRISGEHNQIDALQRIFDQMPPDARDLKPYSIHAIAGVLKLFFRKLKEPLMTFKVYDKIVKIERTVGSSTLTEEQIEEYKETLQMLGDNLPTLKYLISFLVKEVSTHSDVNRMSPSNLAIVFGPTLMRPEVETMETTLNSPLVNHGIERIIDNYSIFFPE